MRQPHDRRLTARHALALGLLHGPTELLPVSSSAHTALVPWLRRWPYADLDPELRKAFEVALHAGTAAALMVALRDDVREAIVELDARRAGLIAGSFLPAAAIGLALERPIEQRLGAPGPIAIGLLAGSAAMAIADTRAQRSGARRPREDATLGDALALGVGQACALLPGTSRNGMTLAAARARGFGRADANVLSRHVALPVIVGASVLKAGRLGQRGIPPGFALPLAIGAAGSCASTLFSTRLIGQVERDRSFVPYAVYRSALAASVLVTLRRRRQPPLAVDVVI